MLRKPLLDFESRLFLVQFTLPVEAPPELSERGRRTIVRSRLREIEAVVTTAVRLGSGSDRHPAHGCFSSAGPQRRRHDSRGENHDTVVGRTTVWVRRVNVDYAARSFDSRASDAAGGGCDSDDIGIRFTFPSPEPRLGNRMRNRPFLNDAAARSTSTSAGRWI